MTCGKSLRAIDLKLSRRCCREFGGSLMNLQMMQKMMDDAVAHHRAGRIGDAERAYRDILQLNRHHTDALNLLAMLLCQTGRAQEAASVMQQAVEAAPLSADFHLNL